MISKPLIINIQFTVRQRRAKSTIPNCDTDWTTARRMLTADLMIFKGRTWIPALSSCQHQIRQAKEPVDLNLLLQGLVVGERNAISAYRNIDFLTQLVRRRRCRRGCHPSGERRCRSGRRTCSRSSCGSRPRSAPGCRGCRAAVPSAPFGSTSVPSPKARPQAPVRLGLFRSRPRDGRRGARAPEPAPDQPAGAA